MKIWLHFMGKKNEMNSFTVSELQTIVAMVQKTRQIVPKQSILTVGLWVRENMCILGNQQAKGTLTNKCTGWEDASFDFESKQLIWLPMMDSWYLASFLEECAFRRSGRLTCYCRRMWVLWKGLKASQTRFSKLEKMAELVTAPGGEWACLDADMLPRDSQTTDTCSVLVSTCLVDAGCCPCTAGTIPGGPGGVWSWTWHKSGCCWVLMGLYQVFLAHKEMMIFVLKTVILMQSPELWILAAHYSESVGDPDPTSLEKPRLHTLQGGSEATEVADKTWQETGQLWGSQRPNCLFCLHSCRGTGQKRS